VGVQNHIPPPGRVSGVIEGDGVVGHEDLVLEPFSDVLPQMLGVQDDRVAQRVFRHIRRVLEPVVAIREVPSLAPPHHLAPEKSFRDCVHRKEVPVPHVDEHEHDLESPAMNEASDSGGGRRHCDELELDLPDISGLNSLRSNGEVE
jgi:hypothetical protein